MQAPDLFPFLHQVPTSVWAVIALAAVAVFLYKKVLKGIGVFGSIGVVGLLGMATVGLIVIHGLIAGWQNSVNHPHTQKAVTNVLTGGIPSVPDLGNGLDATSPLAHVNPWVTSALIELAIVWLIGYLVFRSMSPVTKAHLRNRLYSNRTVDTPKRKDDKSEFPLVEVEVGISKDTGKPIVIGGKDRFINTLIIGSIGTGKTSRILTKQGYQDVLHIAKGERMDLIVMDPDGGLCSSIVDFAKENGIEPFIIDLRGEMGSNCALNPFAGGDIADIVDNVRAVLKEQMGEQEAFFQNVQDDLIRTVIQVQVPIWEDTDFIKFAELVTDPIHFRAICNMVSEYAMQRAPKKGKKKNEWEEIQSTWEHEREFIEQRYDEMSEHMRSMVLSASRSFLMDTRNEQKLEHLEKITKGLKIVVSELATNSQMRSALSKSDLPTFDFQSFLAAGKDEPGRVVAVVTGNRPVGNLFGKLFLVTLKMHALARPGNENTRRPVYIEIDEFHRFATDSLSDWFAQGRKYRTGITLAIQTRAQLQLSSNRTFVDIVEGSCRNKIYFPSPAPADAKYLQDALGTVKNLKETHTENKLSFFFVDNRHLDRRIATREEVDPRFRIEDLLYSLTKDEAIFLMTVDNQAQEPCVGYTSFADEWVKKRSPRKKQRVVKEVKLSDTHPTGEQPEVSRRWPFRRQTAEPMSMESQMSTKDEPTAQVEVAATIQSSNTASTTPSVEVTTHVKASGYLKASANPDDVIVVGDKKSGPVEPAASDNVVPAHEPENYKETTIQEETAVEVATDTGQELGVGEQNTIDVPKDESKPAPIPIRASVEIAGKSVGMTMLRQDIQQAKSTNDGPVPAARFDLRKRPATSGTGQSENAETSKQCPGCKADHLQLTPDAKKWRCYTCGYEKKNRKA